MGGYLMIQAQPASSWSAVASSGNGEFVCASQYLESIYCSFDAGESWSKTQSPQLPWTSMSMSTPGDFVVAVSSSGSVYTSTTFGDTWRFSSTEAYGGWLAVDCDTTGKYVVMASSSAVIAVSNNFGHSWTYVLAFPSNAIFHGVTVDATGQYVIAVGLSYIYYSSNYGDSYNKTETATSGIFFQSVSSDESGKYALATASTGIYHTSDFGRSWKLVYSSVSNVYWGAVALNSAGEVGFVGTSNGGLYQSKDGGISWAELDMLPTESFWGDVTIDQSGSHIVAVLDGGAIYTSSDGGTTWEGHLTSCEVGTSYNPVTGDCEYCCFDGTGACTQYNDGSMISCQACPEFQLSFDDHATCTNPCAYPFVPVYVIDETAPISYTCTELNVQTPTFGWSLVTVMVGGLFLLNLVLVEQHVARYRPAVPMIVICSTAIPVLEHLSLWLFVLRGTMHSSWVLMGSCVCLCLSPIWFLLSTLCKKRRDANVAPNLFLLPGTLSSWEVFDRIDNIPKLFIQCVLMLPTLLLNSIWMIPMLAVLFLLFATKLHAFGPLYNAWFHRWSGRNDLYEKEQLLSVPEFVESRVISAVLQSLPMMFVLVYNKRNIKSVANPHSSVIVTHFALVMSVLSLSTLLLRYIFISLHWTFCGQQGLLFPNNDIILPPKNAAGSDGDHNTEDDEMVSKDFFPVQYPPVSRTKPGLSTCYCCPFSIFASTYWLDLFFVNDPEADLEAYKRRTKSSRFSLLYSVDQSTGKDLLGRPLPSGKTAQQMQEEEEAEAAAAEEELRLEELRLHSEVDSCIARNRAKWHAFKLEIRRSMAKIESELNRRIEAQAALAAAADLIHIPTVVSKPPGNPAPTAPVQTTHKTHTGKRGSSNSPSRK
jgi:photosystem II stability/assembly factor-like uncharacterized protein